MHFQGPVCYLASPLPCDESDFLSRPPYTEDTRAFIFSTGSLLISSTHAALASSSMVVSRRVVAVYHTNPAIHINSLGTLHFTPARLPTAYLLIASSPPLCLYISSSPPHPPSTLPPHAFIRNRNDSRATRPLEGLSAGKSAETGVPQTSKHTRTQCRNLTHTYHKQKFSGSPSSG